ncbi:hypothetical protein ACJX0J_031645, partial [Zea mays]
CNINLAIKKQKEMGINITLRVATKQYDAKKKEAIQQQQTLFPSKGFELGLVWEPHFFQGFLFSKRN